LQVGRRVPYFGVATMLNGTAHWDVMGIATGVPWIALRLANPEVTLLYSAIYLTR